MERLNKSEKIFKIFSYIVVILFALLALYPVVYAFSVSISGKVAYESGQIVLLPKDVTLQAYYMILHNKGFWISYTNTLFYTVLGTAWSMFVSCKVQNYFLKDNGISCWYLQCGLMQE